MITFETNIYMLRKNIFSILVALLLLYLSLANASSFRKINIEEIPFLDKIVHFGMYFLLMSVVIFEHRKSIRRSRDLLLLAVFPLIYGIIIEILQMSLTTTRSGDAFDALADAAGVAVSASLFWILRSIFSVR